MFTELNWGKVDFRGQRTKLRRGSCIQVIFCFVLNDEEIGCSQTFSYHSGNNFVSELELNSTFSSLSP